MIATYLLHFGLGCIATLGFAMLFNVPRRALVLSAAIGGGAHFLQFLITSWGISGSIGTLVGALFVGLVGAIASCRLALPMVVFSITGIIPMIPGIPAFEILVRFSQGDIPGGLQSAVQAGFGVGAIAAGIGTARLMTDEEWGFGRE